MYGLHRDRCDVYLRTNRFPPKGRSINTKARINEMRQLEFTKHKAVRMRRSLFKNQVDVSYRNTINSCAYSVYPCA